MVESGNWTILGSDDLAQQLKRAAAYLETTRALTVSTGGRELPSGAVATGEAILHDQAATIIPDLLGFRGLEEIARQIRSGETGRTYGCFGSYRLGRGVSSEEIRDRALLPLVAYATLLFPADVERVWAKNASLFHEQDAWFVTVRLRDGVILTLEAFPAVSGGAPPELLIEVTGSGRVLRAEPMRQAVTVETLDGTTHGYPWWEDRAERLLGLIRSGEFLDETSSRLRQIWEAVQRSSQTGKPASL